MQHTQSQPTQKKLLFYPSYIDENNKDQSLRNSLLSSNEHNTKHYFCPISKIYRTPPIPSKRITHYQKLFVEGIPPPTDELEKRFIEMKLIGTGSYWNVYKCYDNKTHQIKVVKVSIRTNQLLNYKKERNSMKILQNKTMYLALNEEMYYDSINFYAVMPKFETTKEMNDNEIIFTIWCVLMGLKIMNMHDLVHLDVKLENLLIDKNGMVKLGDFGTATKIGEVVDSDECGDGRYLAPEVLQGHALFESDVYSLGICLFEMVSRRIFNPLVWVINFFYRLSLVISVYLNSLRTKHFEICFLILLVLFQQKEEPQVYWLITQYLKLMKLCQFNYKKRTNSNNTGYS
ncbi:cyclin-dependent protein kinase PHO85, putative [Entamoeba dispar SAW760]|uniref:Cyclin-dependent protein kinase PHO85, putative n=1 Tax=Entamoeba dispar (strain ATCC PRA-260 / SAW760) TaxID=370354 RepID=B0E9J0_ENTDS|nr:cyclin-dependent protein kinase PHO85, putative [Entamoeba dispar SAW760]EDR28797.1 cyclin-dependent protein kinase PHO85, putative [Entamoeba dispar SAW760]|eukprot:EDR28797.1 cyclin-dependent protein kinase PHO85, putative [Entamoeba dispar SAW760]